MTETKKRRIILFLSIAVLAFWLLGRVLDVYYFAFVGAAFEFLWFPVIALTLALPVLSFISWREEKFNARSAYLYSILIILLTILLMLFYK